MSQSVEWRELSPSAIEEQLCKGVDCIKSFPWYDSHFVTQDDVFQAIVRHLQLDASAYRFVPTACALTAEQQIALFDVVAEHYRNALAHAPLCVHERVDSVKLFLKGNPAFSPANETTTDRFCRMHGWMRTQDLVCRAEYFALACFKVTHEVAIELLKVNPWILDDPRVEPLQHSTDVIMSAITADWNCHPSTIPTNNASLVAYNSQRLAQMFNVSDWNDCAKARLKILPSVWTNQGLLLMPVLLKGVYSKSIIPIFLRIAQKHWCEAWK